jgi:hypothetical protein
MNPSLLTKVAKFLTLGSFTAYLSFASKNNESVKQFFFYLASGTLTTFLIAMLWESRDFLVSDSPTEETLTTLVSGLSSGKPKRQYYLSAQARLEIVIAFAVIIVCALVGGI